MGKYSIKELERLSGIKAHTIRIWEKRYALVSPSRTSTNIRYYSDNDLKKIINTAIVNNAGVKISHIARMTSEEINKLVHQHSDKSIEISPIDQLVSAMVDLNEEGFVKVLSKLNAKFGFEHTIIQVVYPFLEKIGILWQTGNITPAQEHFISNIIRQKIIVAIDGLAIPALDATKAVLFLPENEYHEIGLLFQSYVARKHGIRTIYLGQSVPYADVKNVVHIHKPKFLITSFITALHNNESQERLLRNLSHDFKDLRILISGRAAASSLSKKLKNVRIFKTPIELKELLSQ